MKYDDGFVAYLNGFEAAHANAPDELAWDSLATASHSDAEAVIAEEFDLTPLKNALVPGENLLAVQGLNTSLDSSDLLFLPKLTATGTIGLFVRGDVNLDNELNIADVVFALSYLFSDGAAPSCLDSADTNDDGMINIADAVAELTYLFSGGAALPDPFGECGSDPTDDTLSCESYPPCE